MGGTCRRRRLVLRVLACAALAAACGGASQQAGGIPSSSRDASDTGSAAAGIGLQTPNSPLVTLRVMVGAGSVDDPVGKNGVNALTALTVGRGGTVALTYQELTTTLYPWAASIGAQ